MTYMVVFLIQCSNVGQNVVKVKTVPGVIYLAYKISLLLFKLCTRKVGGEESKFLSLFWSVGSLSVALLCALLLVTIYVPLVVLPTRSLAHPNQNQAVTMETPPQQQPSTTTNQHTEK